ncbi:MAG: SDR family NAD(P)-dependent oxidoreductase [Planctomycetales bacterium]
MAKREISGMRTLITGASSGIGREIALELARQGANSVLLARRAEKLESLADQINADASLRGKVEIVVGDVTDQTARSAAIEKAQSAYGGLDALVNNAGIGSFGRFIDGTTERLRQIMEVNFFAPVELIREALPALQAGSSPIVVNVSSILGHRGIPRMHEYCSSKFALQGFTQSLRLELRKIGIDVLMVSPGTTETDFFDQVVHGRGDVPWPKGKGTPARSVARATVKAIRRGKREIIPSLLGWLLVWANKSAPSLVDRGMRKYG